MDNKNGILDLNTVPLEKRNNPSEFEVIRGKMAQCKKAITFARAELDFLRTLANYKDEELKKRLIEIKSAVIEMEKKNTYELINLYGDLQSFQEKQRIENQ